MTEPITQEKAEQAVNAAAKASLEVNEPPPKSKEDQLVDKLMEDWQPISANPYMKLFVFGPPGAGKTTFMAGAPKLFGIDVDKGAVSIAKLVPNAYRFRNIQRLEMLIKMLKKGHPRFDEFETVGIDTVSEIHKRGLTDIAYRDNRTNKFKFEGEDHGENNERVRQIVSDLRDLDRHIVVTCHRKVVGAKDEVKRMMPDFSDKLTSTVNAVFDIQSYLYEETDMDGTMHRYMVFKSSSHEVKTRINTLPAKMLDPTWKKIYAKYSEFIQDA